MEILSFAPQFEPAVRPRDAEAAPENPNERVAQDDVDLRESRRKVASKLGEIFAAKRRLGCRQVPGVRGCSLSVDLNLYRVRNLDAAAAERIVDGRANSIANPLVGGEIEIHLAAVALLRPL